MDSQRVITIREFKDLLNSYPDDYELNFSGLDFYRLKRRGDNTVQVEFNQTVYKDKNGLVVIDNHE